LPAEGAQSTELSAEGAELPAEGAQTAELAA